MVSFLPATEGGPLIENALYYVLLFFVKVTIISPFLIIFSSDNLKITPHASECLQLRNQLALANARIFCLEERLKGKGKKIADLLNKLYYQKTANSKLKARQTDGTPETADFLKVIVIISVD